MLGLHRPELDVIVIDDASQDETWPVLSTAALSVVWSHALVLAVLVRGISEPLGAPPPSIAPSLAVFSVFTVIAGIAQAGAGMWLDRHADRPILRQLPWVAWYPAARAAGGRNAARNGGAVLHNASQPDRSPSPAALCITYVHGAAGLAVGGEIVVLCTIGKR